MLVRRHKRDWFADAFIAVGVALIAVGAYKLLGLMGAVLVGGP